MGGGRGFFILDGQISWNFGCSVFFFIRISYFFFEFLVSFIIGCFVQFAFVSVWRKGMGEGKGRGQEASLCWGVWVFMVFYFKRDFRFLGEGSQVGGSLVQFQKVVWERVLGNFLEGFWFLQDQINFSCISMVRQRVELRRGGSSRLFRSKVRGEGFSLVILLYLDLIKVGLAR